MTTRFFFSLSSPLGFAGAHTFDPARFFGFRARIHTHLMYRTPPNEQAEWGGTTYQPQSPSVSSIGNYPQQTLIGRQGPDGHQASGMNPSSQVPFTASYSNDLFNPTLRAPSVSSVPIFSLPEVHFPPNSRAYTQPHDTFSRVRAFHADVPPHFSRTSPIAFSSRPARPATAPPAPSSPLPFHNVASSSIPFFNPLSIQLPYFPHTSSLIPPPFVTPHVPGMPHQSHQPASNTLSYASQPSSALYNPPIQYVYCLPASSSPLSSSSHFPSHTSSKTLPSISHISLLNSKSDFHTWDEGVTSLLHHLGLLGHILGLSEPLDPSRPDRMPLPEPVLLASPTPAELTAFTRWWDDDNIAQHVLMARLGSTPRGLLPFSNITNRSARSIYSTLTHYYGLCSWSDGSELLNTLNASICTPGRVQEYVSKWRTGISRLRSARFPINVKILISNFVRGLPIAPAFNTLRTKLSSRISRAGEHDLGAFIAVTETALDLEATFRAAAQAQNPRSIPPTRPSVHVAASVSTPTPAAPPNNSSTIKPSTTNVVAPAVERINRSALHCSNCNRPGHISATCFQPGGGMEGQRGEYRGNKGKAVAMFAEMMEDAYNSCATLPPPEPELSYPLVDSEEDPNVPLAPLPVSSFLAPNPTIRRNYFAERDPDKFPMAFMSNSVEDFKSIAFLSLGGHFNSALDSGCTDHIIRHCEIFQNYDTSKAVSIGTANSGSLEALAGGDVSFRVPYHDRHGQVQQILFTLRNCLYAPDAPVNLISVGALNEQGLVVTFTPGASTELSLPPDDPDLPGFTFHATVIRRLSLLHCDFILPGDDLLKPSAFPAISFPDIVPSPSLWHRRFGHLGKDAMRAALTQDYVRGAVFQGPFSHENCIACIIGKSPQHSYAHNGRRASQIGELLHMDLCGPYPTQGPHGENHFYVILDDCLNVGFTFCLRKKSDAFVHYERTEAYIERSTGCKIKAVRVDGALELTAGKMGAHLTSWGIAIQKTAPYAHPQAGKIERYVRTIEEGGQTLLADSGLSMLFWCDAVLTSQYLRNRLSTSTLAANITPFEVLTRTKPDVSHLRVWGCQCFVAIPNELRDKAGFKRFEGIFVGYEEHRLGWRVRDLKGKYHFSRDVIFNEDLSGRLGVPRSLPLPTLPSSDPSGSSLSSHPTRDCVRTTAGRAYDDILKLKELRRVERDTRRKLASPEGRIGVAIADGGAGVDGDVDVDGGANVALAASVDLSPSAEAICGILSLQTSSSFPDAVDVETESLALTEPEIFWVFSLAAVAPSRPRVFDLTKAPSSYSEAIARSDAPAWRAAMAREEQSLRDMGAFEEVDLPPGQNTVGLIWVFANKTDANGVIISGKEKARVVAQGFSQRPGQFDETYAPVAKMASVWILIAWAAVQDLEIFQFDCKTAFLHAKL